MWTVSGEFGGWNSIGRDEVVVTGHTDTNGSNDLFHKIRVPPLVRDFTKGSSGSYLSAEFKEALYTVESELMASERSCAKIWGSLRKMKSGW